MERREYKMVIAMRGDLKISVGKVAVQAAHAAVAAYDLAIRERPEWAKSWLEGGQKKVVVKVSSLQMLMELKSGSDSLGIPSVVIEDAGLTELSPGTVTALGIGPAPSSMVDKITGSLPLY